MFRGTHYISLLAINKAWDFINECNIKMQENWFIHLKVSFNEFFIKVASIQMNCSYSKFWTFYFTISPINNFYPGRLWSWWLQKRSQTLVYAGVDKQILNKYYKYIFTLYTVDKQIFKVYLYINIYKGVIDKQIFQVHIYFSINIQLQISYKQYFKVWESHFNVNNSRKYKVSGIYLY